MGNVDQCRRGHLFTPENTRVRENKGKGTNYRECRTCVRLREAGRLAPLPPPGRPGSTALEALVLAYLAYRRDGGAAKATVDGWRAALLGFAAMVGDRPPAEVTRADVERWVNRPGLAPSTRRGARSFVSVFFRWATAEGHVPADPTLRLPRVRIPRALPRALPAGHVEALLGRLPDNRARCVVLLEYDCGLRACEVAGLRVEDVAVADQTIRVTGKGGHQRTLPVPDRAWAALLAEVAGRSSGPVVRSANPPGKSATLTLTDRPVTPNHLCRLTAKWMRDAGLDATGHALRHSFAGDLVRGGADLAAVQQLLGHTNLAVTSRYLAFEDPQRLREAMARRHTGATVPDHPTTDPAMLAALVDVVADLAAQVAELRAQLGSAARTAI